MTRVVFSSKFEIKFDGYVVYTNGFNGLDPTVIIVLTGWPDMTDLFKIRSFFYSN
jgi:hypothetical protein